MGQEAAVMNTLIARFLNLRHGQHGTPIGVDAEDRPAWSAAVTYPPKPAPWLAYDATPPVAEVRPAPVRGVPGCGCDECQRDPGASVVTYAETDSVDLLWQAAIRDGRYEDIDAYAEETAVANIHGPAMATTRRIHRYIDAAKAAAARGAS
jgi:hypothetical protein